MLAKFLRQVVTTISAWATLLGFALAFRNRKKDISVGWVLVLVISGALLLLNLAYDYRDFLNSRARIFRQQKDSNKKDVSIRKYMTDWMRSGGRTTILTRDMSWVDDEARQLLSTKAEHGELTILAEKAGVQVIEGLAAKGAKVYYYGQAGFVPKTRFTIINDQSIGPCVLVGRPKEQDHIIEKYSDPDSPVTSLAIDLAAYFQQVSTK